MALSIGVLAAGLLGLGACATGSQIGVGGGDDGAATSGSANGPSTGSGSTASGSCSGSLTSCSGACVDTESDPAHCGDCATVCGATEVCSGGSCMAECPGSTKKCGAACVDTATSAAHCGACDAPCPDVANAGETCAASTCGFTCDMGFGDCNGVASDGCETPTTADPLHCGSCSGVCGVVPNGAPGCASSMCGVGACNPGFGDCDMLVANGCEVDTNTTFAHCGTCNHACVGTQTCVGGTCMNAPVLVGQYTLGAGPAWGTNPPTQTCQEACAIIFGGAAAQYSCSITPASVTHTAWVDGYADLSHCQGNTPVAENYKANTSYNCGSFGCSYSAWVTDNCPSSVNYCFM